MDERDVDVAVVGGKARRPLSPHHGVRSVVNCCSFGRQRACRSFVRSSGHRLAELKDDEKGSGKMTPEGGGCHRGRGRFGDDEKEVLDAWPGGRTGGGKTPH
jgi:hypothetical protein